MSATEYYARTRRRLQDAAERLAAGERPADPYDIFSDDLATVEFMGDDTGAYDLGRLWRTSPAADDPLRSPDHFAYSTSGMAWIHAVAEMRRVPVETLIRQKHDGSWWAAHPVALRYARWLDESFSLLLDTAAILGVSGDLD